ncbi:magnesium transporter, partial [bacterium]|nr:magnesium transporter [bacterium]
RVLVKEMLTGLVNGVAIAVVAGIGVTIWDGRWQLGLVIALAMVASMGIAGIAGAAIPIALQRLGQDPAQSSSIFLTTVTDVVGFATFLGLAAMFAPLLT